MSTKQDDVVKALGNMTVMQLIALTKELEQKWDVKAEPKMVAVVPTNTTPVEEKTEFDIVLISFAADKKMTVVKAVRELSGLGLVESKNLVEAAPKLVKEGLSKEDAASFQAKLIEAGAVVEVK